MDHTSKRIRFRMSTTSSGLRLLIKGWREILIVALLFIPTTAFCQAPAPDLEGLKNRLAKLENEVQAIRSAITSIETKTAPAVESAPEVHSKVRPVEPASQVPLPSVVHIGAATDTRETINQVEVGATRINNESLDPARRGYFKLPLTDTLIQINGFVKSDLFIDTNYAGAYSGAYVPSLFPSSPQPHSVNSSVVMKASRLALTILQPASAKTVKGYFEVDALGSTSGTSIRIRHIYAQYLNILGGQTWSAFGDPDVFPNTLEFEGPPGIIGLRNPQIRYTQAINAKHSIGFSVENPGTDTPANTPFGTPTGTSTRPDLVAFYRLETPHGHIQSAFISRSVGGVVAGTSQSNLRQHLNGYGASLSGAFAFGRNKGESIVAQAVIGKGISNYYNDNFGLGSDVGFSANN
ncbi:DcaP family trimeric outer membrane transporter [Terriglobus roseus]|uniref:DcaP family trimeric outer membrane transporter n=1 Tax=Terriglobus roseus TaxID=392734 RepID=UPI000317E7CF|nr:DcaP family trimeric outer membrane transporter [Terriglobus roseus]